MSGISRKVTDFFQRKVSETTFLNDEDRDFQIHSNEEQTNYHAIDQTCPTSSCIPGESRSKVILESQPFHPASSFQFPKKKCGNRERPCQANWFQKSLWLHYDTRLVRLFCTEGAIEKCSRQKLCEIPVMKEFVFSKFSG